jgi:hypothetical protein
MTEITDSLTAIAFDTPEEAKRIFVSAVSVGEIACRQNPDAFFPDIGEDKNGKERMVMPEARLEAAQALCARCVVFEACQTANKREKFGVWAGVNKGARAITQKKQLIKISQLRELALEQAIQNDPSQEEEADI